jgi:SCY1-like protein 1
MHFHDLNLFFQLATTDMQTPINSMGGPEIDRPTSAPPTKSLSNGEILPSHSASFQSSPAVASPQGAAKGNTLRLGANKASSSIAIDSLVNKLAEETAQFATIEGNPWGSDDLIDMNADADDWGMLAFF